jgi:hypothetical protein
MNIKIPEWLQKLFLLGLTCWSGAVVSSAEGLAMEFKVGQPFPEMVLPSLEDGRPSSVSELRGQKLILHIFASW